MRIGQIPSEAGLPGPTGKRVSARKTDDESSRPSHNLGWTEIISANPQVVETTLDDFKQLVNGLGLKLDFSKDPETGQTVITVFDSHTGEIIRQIPPQELQAILRNVRSNKALSSGLFVSRHL